MKKAFLIFCLIISLFNFQAARADSYLEDDLQLWVPVYITFPVKDKIKGYFEVNPRTGDNVTDFSQLIIRPAVGYQVNDKLSLWQGYAWVTNYLGGFRNENRIFQQLIYQHKFLKKLLFIHRARLEERLIEDTGSTAIRGRYMLRAHYPLGKSKKWSLALYDEIFLNLNSVAGGPNAGLDQNRLFGGINKKINDQVNAELGYQMQLINRQAPVVDHLVHGVLMNIFINL